MLNHTGDLRATIRSRIPATPDGVPAFANEIAEVVATIVERFDPERIVLFGSRARGTPRADSDIDMMVIRERLIPQSQLRDEIRSLVSVPVPLGLYSRTPRDIRVGLREQDFFLRNVMRQGTTLYASPRADPVEGEAEAEPEKSTASGLKNATLQWLRHAPTHFAIANLVGSSSPGEAAIACHHAQEGAKESLRALLQEWNLEFGRDDDLVDLARLAATLIPEIRTRDHDLAWLSRFTLDVCYPGSSIDNFDVPRALAIASSLLAMVRDTLGLPTG